MLEWVERKEPVRIELRYFHKGKSFITSLRAVAQLVECLTGNPRVAKLRCTFRMGRAKRASKDRAQVFSQGLKSCSSHPPTPGVASSIPVRSHTFVEIDHEMISTVILPLLLIHSRRVVVSYKRKYVHELLVNRLFKPAHEKVWLGELTVPQ